MPYLPRKVPRRHGRPKPTPSVPPSTISATLATQNEGGCDIVLHLPYKTKVYVRLCYACYAMFRITAATVTQNEGGCVMMPRLPSETKVDVALCHTCHAKCRGVTGDQNQPPSAPPSAMTTTPATQNQDNSELCYCRCKVHTISFALPVCIGRFTKDKTCPQYVAHAAHRAPLGYLMALAVQPLRRCLVEKERLPSQTLCAAWLVFVLGGLGSTSCWTTWARF